MTFLAFLMIAAWPLIVLFKHLGFEKRRKAAAGDGGSFGNWSDDD